MCAMVLEQVGGPLVERELPDPEPAPGGIRARVRACAVCRTDLHVYAGELPAPKLPLVLGHQIVGETHDGRRAPGRRGGQAFARQLGVAWAGGSDESPPLAARVPVQTHVEELPLARANEALERVRAGQVRGSLVLTT